ncbi:MAG: FMN-binding protein [Succinivibrionaceae bacterium]|nr:FMN-binding protein [Succinivibrionaceae bacterium]
MKKYLSASLVLLAAAFSVQGCEREYDSKHFIPGVYETESSRDSTIGYSTARVTIKNRRITAIEYHSYTPDGKLKDAEYGKKDGVITDQERYRKAQHALAAAGHYVKQMLEVQNLAMVDGVTGASVTYDQFKEAVGKALEQAERKFDPANVKDGTFSGRSGENNSHHGDYSVVELTVKNHKITGVSFMAYTADGKIKDENYGRRPVPDKASETQMTEEQKSEAEKQRQKAQQHYQLAQDAIKNHPKYVEQLLATQDPGKVDAVTGATHSYDQFTEAVAKALEQAERR